MSKLITVTHTNPQKADKLGLGYITGFTQAPARNEKGEIVTVVYANVSWSGIRTPAVSFEPVDDLIWEEIEGVTSDGDLIENVNFDLEEEEESLDDNKQE